MKKLSFALIVIIMIPFRYIGILIGLIRFIFDITISYCKNQSDISYTKILIYFNKDEIKKNNTGK